MITLFVNKRIRNFRIASNMSQTKLAAISGIHYSIICEYETGKRYPADMHIAKLNELGANIHPIIFSHLLQRLSVVVPKRKSLTHRNDSRRFNCVAVSKDERLWIKEQMLLKNVSQRHVATRAGCSVINVRKVLAGKCKSNNVKQSLAETLGFETWQELCNAIVKKKALPRGKCSDTHCVLKKRAVEGQKITEQERQWIKGQLQKQKADRRMVAEKAECHVSNYDAFIRGKHNSRAVQQAIATLLRFSSFEELLAAYQQDKASAEGIASGDAGRVA